MPLWHDGAMNWWVVGSGGLAALVAVIVAFLVDRASAKRRRRALAAAPDQPVLAGAGTPAYVTAATIKESAVPGDLDDDTRADITADLASATTVAAGWASPDFVTDHPSGWAVLDQPLVLVAESVATVRSLYPLVERARAAATGLVIVADQVDTPVVATLALNALAGTLACLAVRTSSVHEVAALIGATVVSPADLAADYLPAGTLGHPRRWVSDHDQSWIWADDAT